MWLSFKKRYLQIFDIHIIYTIYYVLYVSVLLYIFTLFIVLIMYIIIITYIIILFIYYMFIPVSYKNFHFHINFPANALNCHNFLIKKVVDPLSKLSNLLSQYCVHFFQKNVFTSVWKRLNKNTFPLRNFANLNVSVEKRSFSQLNSPQSWGVPFET